MESEDGTSKYVGSTEAEDTAAVMKRVKELVDLAFSLKNEAAELEKKAKKVKSELCELMENSEIDKLSATDCTASLSLKNSVTVPKEDDKKLALFGYIENNYGPEVLQSMLTINAKTFSSWYDKLVEEKVGDGDVDFKLDMLSPYSYYSVGFRKKAVKK